MSFCSFCAFTDICLMFGLRILSCKLVTATSALGNKVQIVPDPIGKSASYWCCFGGCRKAHGKASCPSRRDLANHSSGRGFWGEAVIFFPLRPVLVVTGALILPSVSSMQPKLRVWFGSHPLWLSCECVSWCNGLFYRLEWNTNVAESKNSFFKYLLILTLWLLEVDSVLCDLADLLPHSFLCLRTYT